MKSSLNILISSAGRQVFLVNAFKDALDGKGKVFVNDFNPNAESFKVADEAFVAPAYHQESFMPWIISICKTKEIKLLVSLNVDELLILEHYRKYFAEVGCTLVGGPMESIQITYDKYALFDFIKKLKLPTITTWLIDEILTLSDFPFPLIAKKRFGKGSRGQFKITNKQELILFFDKVESNNTAEEYIFQEYLDGIEYGFDLVNDFQGNFQAILARRKYAMKNGETHKAITENPDKWQSFGETLSKNLKHQGTIDMDVMVFKDEPFLLDINFRFGGGYAFSHLAGANIPAAYINWLMQEPLKSGHFNVTKDVKGERIANGTVIETAI